tara:strand:- start:51 stop:311 length:261 start_codon:yes stop_codon:yes gene_type:complete
MHTKLEGMTLNDRCEIDICSTGYARIMIYNKELELYEEINIFEDNIKGMTWIDMQLSIHQNLGDEFAEWAIDTPVFRWWMMSLMKK